MTDVPTSAYYATDKDLFDIFMGENKFGESQIKELARGRGIIFGKDDKKKAIIEHLSTLVFDYHDVSLILSKIASHPRADKCTSVTLSNDISVDEFKQAVTSLIKESSQADPQDRITHSHIEDGGYGVELSYKDIDYSRNRLSQKISKTADIDFVPGDGEVTIRFPANEKAKKFVEALEAKIAEVKKEPISTKVIQLGSLDQVTDFLTALANNVPDCVLQDVTRIALDRPRASGASPTEDDDVEDAGEEDDNEDLLSTEARKEVVVAETKLMGLIEKVSISGSSLLTTPEYKELKAKGFFVSKLSWTAKEKGESPNIVSFDAGFDKPAEGQGFRYDVPGVRYWNGSEYPKHPRAPKEEDRRRLLKLLEAAAQGALSTVAGTTDDTPPMA